MVGGFAYIGELQQGTISSTCKLWSLEDILTVYTGSTA